jgi:hypothetical protein
MMMIVDGTGPYDEAEYKYDMTGSFCNQLKGAMPNTEYYEGPGTLGLTTGGIAYKAFQSLCERRSNRREDRDWVYLAGYSRGGAAVIQIAKWLNDRSCVSNPIPVKAMFLFDPVGWDATLCYDRIPTNVMTCYVVYRDKTIQDNPMPLYKLVATEAAGLAIPSLTPLLESGEDYDRNARKFMGSCQVTPEDSSRTRVNGAITWNASHAAVGGIPWADREADLIAANAVAKLMNFWLLNEAITKVQLKVVGHSGAPNWSAKRSTSASGK